MRSQYNLTWQNSAKAQQNTFALPQKHGDYMQKVRAQILNKRGRVLKPRQQIGPPATTGPPKKASIQLFNAVFLKTGTQQGPKNAEKIPSRNPADPGLRILAYWVVGDAPKMTGPSGFFVVAEGQYWPKSFIFYARGYGVATFYLRPSVMTPKD